MEQIKEIFGKFFFPVILMIVGIILLINSIDVHGKAVSMFERGSIYVEPGPGIIIGSALILLVGIIALLYVLGILSSMVQNILFAVMFVPLGILLYQNVHSVKGELDMINTKAKIRKAKIDRLMDVKEAQIRFKHVYGNYSNDWDSLTDFVKNGTWLEIAKNDSEVPLDSAHLPEKILIEAGLIWFDTTRVSVEEKFFTSSVAMNKRNDRPFDADSMRYVPFIKDEDGELIEFDLMTDFVEVNYISQPVFQVKDPVPYLTDDTLVLGSLTQVKTNGNW